VGVEPEGHDASAGDLLSRENTEDVYAGHDFERGSEVTKAIIERM
jgi:isocitrate dehydrogenase